jgi:hypothetical protein
MNRFNTLVLSLAISTMLAAPAIAKPAGYIVTWDPGDAALEGRAAVEREGEKLTPSLLMPLKDGDRISVTDKATALRVELPNATSAAVGGGSTALDITGEMAADDEAAALMERLAKALAGPSPVQSDSPELRIPMAFDGQNFLLPEGGPVHLSWSGGQAPYTIIFDIDGRRKDFATTREQQVSFDLPKLTSSKLSVIVKDKTRKRARIEFHLRQQLPGIPDAIAKAPVSPEFNDLLVKAWLGQRHDGMWRAHILRLLRNGEKQTALERKFADFLEAGGTY